MARSRSVLIAAAVSSVAACASEPPSTRMPAAGEGIAFRCPAPGTQATFNNASRPVVFNGADATDPFICVATAPNGIRVRRYAGLVPPIPGQERPVRDGLVDLFPLVPGKSVRFSYLKGYSNDPTKRDYYNETWTVGPPATLQIGGRPIKVAIVTQDVDNMQTYGSSAWRSRWFYAVDSGVWVRHEPEVVRGQVFGLQQFTATNLSAP